MMTVQYYDPRAEPTAPAEPYALRADLSGPAVVGLIANGFPDSEAFLEAVEKALAARLPEASFTHYCKHNASIPAAPAMLAEIASQCSVAIAAYGH
jgi:hypothetical protein